MGSDGGTALTPFRQVPAPAPQWIATASIELPPAFEAVAQARRFARSTLLGWDLGELFDDVALVASELVTNALRHAIPPCPDPAPPAAGGPDADGAPSPGAVTRPPPPAQGVRLGLTRWSSRLVCSVRDPSSAAPVARTPDFIAESGRGLHLVASCTETWGWHPLAGAGKVVWALFPAHVD